jgi:antitoxin ParD1/3/4
MNVSLTQELEEFVNRKVQSGMYYSASEVIREGLRLLKDQDALREMRLQELRKEIAVGTEQADRGQFVDGEEAFEKLKAKSAERRRKKAQ